MARVEELRTYIPIDASKLPRKVVDMVKVRLVVENGAEMEIREPSENVRQVLDWLKEHARCVKVVEEVVGQYEKWDVPDDFYALIITVKNGHDVAVVYTYCGDEELHQRRVQEVLDWLESVGALRSLEGAACKKLVIMDCA